MLAALALVAWLLVTGLTSSRDAFGRFAALEAERHAAEAALDGGYVGPRPLRAWQRGTSRGGS